MTFEEFQVLDSIGAYSEFSSVKELKELGVLPSEYHEIIPSECQCGSDMILSDEETILMCCNPKCYLKMAHNLNDMFKYFDCKGIGPETCLVIVKHGLKNGIFKVPSYVEILGSFEEFKFILGHRYDDLVSAVYKIHTTPLKFFEMIQCVGIPDYDKSCKDYFGDVKNFDDLMQKLNEVSIVDYLAKFGVGDLKKSLHLHLFLKDIRAFEILYQGNLIKPALKNIDIVITGPVRPHGESMARRDFVRYCNELGILDGHTLFSIHESSAIQSVNYFIADSPSSSRKYNAARSREEMNPGLKLIYTSTEFVDLIKNEVEKCRRLMNKESQS